MGGTPGTGVMVGARGAELAAAHKREALDDVLRRKQRGLIEAGTAAYLMARTVGGAPNPATVNTAAAWEFYAGGQGQGATWSSRLAEAAPLLHTARLDVRVSKERPPTSSGGAFKHNVDLHRQAPAVINVAAVESSLERGTSPSS